MADIGIGAGLVGLAMGSYLVLRHEPYRATPNRTSTAISPVPGGALVVTRGWF